MIHTKYYSYYFETDSLSYFNSIDNYIILIIIKFITML